MTQYQGTISHSEDQACGLSCDDNGLICFEHQGRLRSLKGRLLECEKLHMYLLRARQMSNLASCCAEFARSQAGAQQLQVHPRHIILVHRNSISSSASTLVFSMPWITWSRITIFPPSPTNLETLACPDIMPYLRTPSPPPDSTRLLKLHYLMRPSPCTMPNFPPELNGHEYAKLGD